MKEKQILVQIHANYQCRSKIHIKMGRYRKICSSLLLTFRRGRRLGGVLVAVGDAVNFFLVSLRGWSFVWGLTYYLKLHIPL